MNEFVNKHINLLYSTVSNNTLTIAILNDSKEIRTIILIIYSQ